MAYATVTSDDKNVFVDFNDEGAIYGYGIGFFSRSDIEWGRTDTENNTVQIFVGSGKEFRWSLTPVSGALTIATVNGVTPTDINDLMNMVAALKL